MEAVNLAAVSTLHAWDENLPSPQTDVERTVRRRIRVRFETLAREEIRQKHPDIAAKMNDLIDKFERLTKQKAPVDRY
ncbi:MAG TPA: hypothetical protein VEC57_14590 [Candidatus Limnocylindrales bacterium]|nr:hypothetical protein [Candidatus Limnocylindrales bacterium]